MIVIPDWLRLWKRMEAWEQMLNAHLVDRECEHGFLPTDPNVTCDCWSGTPATSSSDSSPS